MRPGLFGRRRRPRVLGAAKTRKEQVPDAVLKMRYGLVREMRYAHSAAGAQSRNLGSLATARKAVCSRTTCGGERAPWRMAV